MILFPFKNKEYVVVLCVKTTKYGVFNSITKLRVLSTPPPPPNKNCREGVVPMHHFVDPLDWSALINRLDTASVLLDVVEVNVNQTHTVKKLFKVDTGIDVLQRSSIPSNTMDPLFALL
jgi:hypothetical protein